MMGANSLPKTVTGRGSDLNPGPTTPESSMLTTRLPSHPMSGQTNGNVWRGRITGVVVTGVESYHLTTPRHYRRLTYTYTRLTTIINGQSDVPRDRHTDRPHCNGNNRSHLMQWISMQPKILLCADKSCKQLQQRRMTVIIVGTETVTVIRKTACHHAGLSEQTFIQQTSSPSGEMVW